MQSLRILSRAAFGRRYLAPAAALLLALAGPLGAGIIFDGDGSDELIIVTDCTTVTVYSLSKELTRYDLPSDALGISRAACRAARR